MDLKSTIEAVAELYAELYDAIRLRCSTVLIDKLVRGAELCGCARLLQFATLAGPATLLLAKMGHRICCVGANRVRVVVRDRPKACPSVELASFEVAHLTMDHLDLVRVASAWHWIAPAARTALLEEIRRLIEVQFAGVCHYYAMSLQIVQRK
jgi:hypothetical protein